MSFSCPVCSQTDPKPLLQIRSTLTEVPKGLTRPHSVEAFWFICQECGVLINDLILKEADFKELYTAKNTYSESPTYEAGLHPPAYTKDIQETIQCYTPTAGSIVEIGCFTGNLIKALNQAAYHVTGVELDAGAVTIARKKGLSVHQGELHTANIPDCSADTVVAIAVLEHVENPNSFLQSIHRKLKNRGHVILQFPNPTSLNARISKFSRHGWDMLSEPGHIYIYPEKSIRLLMEKHNFAVKSVFTSTIISRGKVPLLPGRFPLLEAKIRKMIGSRKFIRRLYAAALKILDLFDAGDTLTVVAQKNES